MNRFKAILTGEKPEPRKPVHPSDPRPDLKEDHAQWSAVLRAAWAMYQGDNQLYGLLHGLRCGGARLNTVNGRLKLDYQPLIEDGMSKEELLSEWLRPMQQQIAAAFRRAEGELAGLPPGQALPAWAKTS